MSKFVPIVCSKMCDGCPFHYKDFTKDHKGHKAETEMYLRDQTLKPCHAAPIVRKPFVRDDGIIINIHCRGQYEAYAKNYTPEVVFRDLNLTLAEKMKVLFWDTIGYEHIKLGLDLDNTWNRYNEHKVSMGKEIAGSLR